MQSQRPARHPTGLIPGLLVAGLLVLALPAGAFYQPRGYILTDTAKGAAENGLLCLFPSPCAGANTTNPAQTREILPAADAVAPVQFLTAAGENHTTRLRGFGAVAIWLGPSAVAHGNLTVTVVAVPPTGDPIALGSHSFVLDSDTSKLNTSTALPPYMNPLPGAPDPGNLMGWENATVAHEQAVVAWWKGNATLFVPPAPNPGDPQGSVNQTEAYEEALMLPLAFYELGQTYPLLFKPTASFLFGPLDVNVTADTRIALQFRLDIGSSPLPVPAGAFAQIQYNGTVIPTGAALHQIAASYAIVPWYAPDPVVVAKPTPPVTPPVSTTPSSPHPSASSTANKSPAPELAFVGFVLLAAAGLSRRR